MIKSFRIVFIMLLLNSMNLGLAHSKEGVRYKDEVFKYVRTIKDVKYGAAVTQGAIKQELVMDIYYPKGDTIKNRPLVVFAHGGFFLFGDKAGFKEEALSLAISGYVVASINYRLMDVEETDLNSKFAVIDAVHDMKAAIRFFNKDFANNNIYGIDPTRIFIGGYSAGAVTSLHYAYATTQTDVLEMGGKELLDYVIKNGGLEGRSGNEGFSTNIRGVINIAGSLHKADLIDANEPALFSIHGTNDQIVPYLSGSTGNTSVITEGSGLLHARAKEIGLKNYLITVENGDHFARYSCIHCISDIRGFIYQNL